MKDWLRWLVTSPARGLRVLYAFMPVLARPDDAFAEYYLISAEYRLYAKMDPRDRHHACLIAKRLKERCPRASSELLRAALLHDVGKSAVPYNPFHRIMIGLYLPQEVPISPRLAGLTGIWQLGLYHDHYGAEMIREAGGGERVAELVARHHQPGTDVEARLLKEIDEGF